MAMVKINGEMCDVKMLSYIEKLEEIGGRDFREYVEGLEDEDRLEDKQLETDLLSYEQQLEEYSTVVTDATDELESLLSYLEKPGRIDRVYIKRCVEDILKMIKNSL